MRFCFQKSWFFFAKCGTFRTAKKPTIPFGMVGFVYSISARSVGSSPFRTRSYLRFISIFKPTNSHCAVSPFTLNGITIGFSNVI